MTYKRDNNDPNRTKTVLSPTEVKAMLLGGGDPASDALYEGGAVTWAEANGVLFVDMPHTLDVYRIAFRCPTCGRASDCACEPDCPHCVLGVPKRTPEEQERYAPAGR